MIHGMYIHAGLAGKHSGAVRAQSTTDTGGRA